METPTRRPRKGDELELALERLDPKGFVLGHVGEHLVTVRHAVPGGRVLARVLRRAKGRIDARPPQSIRVPSGETRK